MENHACELRRRIAFYRDYLRGGFYPQEADQYRLRVQELEEELARFEVHEIASDERPAPAADDKSVNDAYLSSPSQSGS